MWRTLRDVVGFIWWLIMRLGKTPLKNELSDDKQIRNIITSVITLLIITKISITRCAL